MASAANKLNQLDGPFDYNGAYKETKPFGQVARLPNVYQACRSWLIAFIIKISSV